MRAQRSIMNLPAWAACQLVPQATILTSVNSRNSCSVMSISSRIDLAGVEGDAAEDGVADGARLLEDFLLHEMLVAALFGHDGVPGDVLDGALRRRGPRVHDAHALRREHGDVTVGEKEDVARVIEDRRDIAGDEVFVLAEADHGRRTASRGDDLVGVFGGEEDQRIDAA